jgi:hypothetical protein
VQLQLPCYHMHAEHIQSEVIALASRHLGPCCPLASPHVVAPWCLGRMQKAGV